MARLGGLIGRVGAFARRMTGPPAVMCTMACFIVLVLADYRVEDLGAAMRPPEPAKRTRIAVSSASRTVAKRKSLSHARDQRSGRKTPALAKLRLDLPIDPSELLVRSDDSSGWAVMHAAAPLERRVRTAAGEIVTTFTRAAAEAGVPELVVSQLADVLGWEFDFTKDLEPGARFRIAYEEEVRHGARVNGRLLGAELQSGGKWHDAYYFQPEHGPGGYYDGDGRALGRDFLRYPVAYTRISSGFAARRFHPVLRVHRPHYGVDFAAPVGTPVRAVAAGVVLKAGWYGASGRFVKLRHDDAHQSGYAHLSRVAPGIQPGATVTKGQTIGYVGQSGRATGAHLHFAMYIDGRYADPLKADLPRTRSLKGRRLASFRFGLVGLSRMLAAADPVPVDEPIVTAALVN